MADDKDDIEDGEMEQGKIWRSEIERYRSGLMNEAERHALEKKSLNDPFLADALEGAEQIPAEAFAEDVRELSGKLARVRSGNWFTPLRIAAGVIILLASGSLIYYFNASEPKQLATKETAGPDSSALARKDSSSGLLSLAKPEEPATGASSPAQQPSPAKADQKIAEVTGQPVAGPGNQQKPAEALDTKADDDLNKIEITASEVEEAKKEAVAESEKTLAAPSAGARKASRAIAANPLYSRSIAGHITSSDDGSPLPGVNVVIKGTNQGTVTDAEGNFQISTQTKNPELVISFIGLETREVSPVDEGLLDVKMNPDTRQLSEVVVSGYGISAKDDSADEAKAFEFASPGGGRSAFQKYLEAGIRYPAQAIASKTEGKVTVQFTVTVNGSLTNFTVIKGIGSGCDEELIRLIQNGPAWTPSRRNQVPIEDKVRVRLRFSLPR